MATCTPFFYLVGSRYCCSNMTPQCCCCHPVITSASPLLLGGGNIVSRCPGVRGAGHSPQVMKHCYRVCAGGKAFEAKPDPMTLNQCGQPSGPQGPFWKPPTPCCTPSTASFHFSGLSVSLQRCFNVTFEEGEAGMVWQGKRKALLHLPLPPSN